MSTSFFVAADWLAEHIDDPEIQIIDARMAPAGQEALRDMAAEYRAGHVPNALFFDIEALSDHTSPLPHMMPRAEAFAVAMRELGVSSDKHLVVYDEGNLFSAPRAWWMLRTFGVEKVSIVAGGLEGWRRDGLPLEQGLPELPEELTSHAIHECDWQKDDNVTQRDGNSSHANLIPPIFRCLLRLFAHEQVPMYILENNNRIIDQYPDT